MKRFLPNNKKHSVINKIGDREGNVTSDNNSQTPVIICIQMGYHLYFICLAIIELGQCNA